jgi:hypothetical protein
MAKKAPVSYAAVELEPVSVPMAEVAPITERPTMPSNKRGRPPAKQTLREAASPVILYLDPKALKALKRYALDQNTKVHSLLIDAVEAWFRSHGLRETVRVQTNGNE